MPSPPPLPSDRIVVYDCLSGQTHEIVRGPFSFGNDSTNDIRLGSDLLGQGKVVISRVRKRVNIVFDGCEPVVEVDGSPFKGGQLPEKEKGTWSLVINRSAFFFVKTGEDAVDWAVKLTAHPKNCWRLLLFSGGRDAYNDWANTQRSDYPGLTMRTGLEFGEIFSSRNKTQPGEWGLIYHEAAYANAVAIPGFFLTQLEAHEGRNVYEPSSKYSATAGQLEASEGRNVCRDEGDLRCHRCWLRFTAGDILAIDPSDYGDAVLGESELKRFIPAGIDSQGRPLTSGGAPCTRLACPHCRGELPPNFLEKPPHLISIVGDSMAGKSYFLSAVVKKLLGQMKRDLGISFTDGDPVGNEALSKMVAKLFSPTENAGETVLEKTGLAGATYKTFNRRNKLVSLPAPFTYNLSARGRPDASTVFYDNAGEHFRPGKSETDKSNFTEHIAWAGGLLFLFDPLQHGDLLRIIHPDADPQVSRMKRNAASLRFDQHVILSEMATRLQAWRGGSSGTTSDVPLAVVLGKHDLLGDAFPASSLHLAVCRGGLVSLEAINENSRRTHEFLLEHCADIVSAAEEVSGNVKYFPASSFGSPAVEISNTGDDSGEAMIGPDPLRLKSYLVEAPFLWLFSELEPSLVPSTKSGKT